MIGSGGSGVGGRAQDLKARGDWRNGNAIFFCSLVTVWGPRGTSDSPPRRRRRRPDSNG
jgi:hypothetical protein